jgi:hypothetical protein
MAAGDALDERAWFIAQRWRAYEGEARANLLRIAGIGTFYLLHLWSYYSSQGKLPNWGVLQVSDAGAIEQRFHLLATLLALAWVMAAAGVHLALRQRVFPRWLSALSTAIDLVMITSVVAMATGPRSPLVAGFLLVIPLAGLRFSLPLVRWTTAGAALGYVCVLGVAKWPERFGREANYDVRVPRYHELIVLAAIVLCGVFVGQIVRQSRRLAEEYALRRSSQEGER